MTAATGLAYSARRNWSVLYYLASTETEEQVKQILIACGCAGAAADLVTDQVIAVTYFAGRLIGSHSA